jgi:hypothetical protein
LCLDAEAVCSVARSDVLRKTSRIHKPLPLY